jgi:hypothetical protein
MRVGYHYFICKRVHFLFSRKTPLTKLTTNSSDYKSGNDEYKQEIKDYNATLGAIGQATGRVPWSLGGRSRKAKKVARSGTTTNWENRVGKN